MYSDIVEQNSNQPGLPSFSAMRLAIMDQRAGYSVA